MNAGRRTQAFLSCGLILSAALCFLVLGKAPPALTAPEPPPAPRWIGLFDMKGKVGIKWIPDPGYASVQIYRRRREGPQEFVLAAETRKSQFVDTGVLPGETYLYRLEATGPSGERSGPSPVRSVKVGRSVPRQVSAPRWEGWLPVQNGVGLKWHREEGEKILVFNIYRRRSSEKEFLLLASLAGTSYRDLDLEAETEYVYVLTALGSDFQESPNSTELILVYAPAPEGEGKGAPPSWKRLKTRLVKVVPGGREGFSRPVDVAVGPLSGQVYLVDSAAGTIEVFTREGAYVRTIESSPESPGLFGKPLGIGVDARENLYVIDSAGSEVVIVTSGGEMVRRIRIRGKVPSDLPGLIDVAVAPDGGAFVVDNFMNRVFLLDDRSVLRSFGERGTEPGQFSAPAFCAVDGDGKVYISDALNGRVQVFSPAGEFLLAFGRFFQGPGGFGRPKGVAVGSGGEIFVADSWLNVIQVFGGDGEFHGVLTDESGELLDLGSPNGIALDGRNRIFIAERLSGRLQIRDIIDEY
jgi:DNA-binding beta-propeller fold protein YncE